jgi:hypothetical protein
MIKNLLDKLILNTKTNPTEFRWVVILFCCDNNFFISIF